ncbi:MAG: rod shape-determining protein MreC [Allosphingosinicella sp.]|uniref:rod shape-determining protein MreC n=1 Tax=Allosphingosinicella sp. TaxID=2823234 RepID=UPI00393483F4
MAPPANRRPGFSRRAQYGLFLGYVLAVAGVLFAVMLLIVAIIDPRGFAALKGASLDATTPVTSAGRGVVNFFTGIGGSVGDFWRAGEQNAELRRELEAARARLTEAEATEYENRRLKHLLEITEPADDVVAVARIVGSTFDSSRRLATLAAGASAGIEEGQPVRGPEGLIGRVLETGRWASRVLLVTDGTSNIPVILLRDGTPAIATGRGDGFIDLKTLEVGSNPFRPGDLLATSGIGGIFPPGIPVARVTEVHGDSATARPLADPGRLDFAIVHRAYQGATNLPLDQARPLQPPPAPGQPPAGWQPPEQPGAAPPGSPQYQPGLQRPQPGVITQPAPPPAQPNGQAQPQPQGQTQPQGQPRPQGQAR